jgi:hypothetical protein
MQGWLKVCDDARSHFGKGLHGPRLKTMPTPHANAARARTLSQIQQRLGVMLKGR